MRAKCQNAKPQHFVLVERQPELESMLESELESELESSWLVMDAKLVDRQAGSAAMAQGQRCHRAGAPRGHQRGATARELLCSASFLCAHGEQTGPSCFLPIGGNGLKPVGERDGNAAHGPCASASEPQDKWT